MRRIQDFGSIYLHRAPVDGRKQMNGLAAIFQGEMGQNPFGEGLFVFTGKRRDTIKLLYWNKSGFALWAYRLEEEKFRWPLKIEDDTVTLTAEQLCWLLDGYDIMRMKPHSKVTIHRFPSDGSRVSLL